MCRCATDPAKLAQSMAVAVTDVGLISIGREGRKTAQKIFCVAEREADGTPHGKIGFDSRNHTFTSGHGWAICLSSATSALA